MAEENISNSLILIIVSVFMRLKAEWAIDSEAMRARGIIIVLVKNYPTSWSKKYRD